MNNPGDDALSQPSSREDSPMLDPFAALVEAPSTHRHIPVETSTISFLTCDEARRKAMQMVDELSDIGNVNRHVAEDLLRQFRWDMTEAVLHCTQQLETKHESVQPSASPPGYSPNVAVTTETPDEALAINKETASEITPTPATSSQPSARAASSSEPVDEIVAVKAEPAVRVSSPPTSPREPDAPRTSRTVWRRLRGPVACATCFEPKNGDVEVLYATDCGIALCVQCWGGYFRAEFSGGVRALVRCPFPDCNSIVPLWLLERCYEMAGNAETAAIMACYRWEFVSDFVFSSENIQFCPSPACDLLVQIHGAGWKEKGVVCRCGFEFCFYCLNEAHFPAECAHAKEIASFLAQCEMYRVAEVFKEAKRCSYCGILIENDGGCLNFQCASCKNLLRWNEMPSCRESLAKACCSRFSKRSSSIEGQLSELLSWHVTMVSGLNEGDRNNVVPGVQISPESWETYMTQTKRVVQLVKWTKVYCALGPLREELNDHVVQKTEDIQVFLQSFRTHLDNHSGTLRILQALQDILRKKSEELVECLEIAIRRVYETQ